MSDVDLVFQDLSHGFTRPGVGTGGIQIGAGGSGSLVVLVGRIQHLLSGQDSGDLVWPFPRCTQVKDLTHNGGGFFIGDNLLGVLVLFLVAVGRFAAQPFPALRLHLLDGAYFLTGVLGVEFVGPVTDRIKVVAALHQGIHAIIDRDKADTLFRKVDLRVLSYLEVFSSQAAEILDDDGLHLVPFHHFYDFLPGRTVKVCTGVAIVRQEQRVFKPMIRRVLFQEEFLVVDGVRLFLPVVPLPLILLTESAV